jgi:hypothetical protein
MVIYPRKPIISRPSLPVRNELIELNTKFETCFGKIGEVLPENHPILPENW